MASFEVLPSALRAVEVGAAFGGVAQLDDGHDVQDPVDLAVPASREPVADVVAGGGVDRGGAGPGAEVVAVGEPGDVADLDQQPGRAGGADAVQVHQAGAGRGDQLGEFLVRGLLALIDPLEVADQLGGDPPTGLAGDVARADRGQQGLGLGGGQVLLRTARDQFQQQVVDLGHLAGVVITQRAAPVDQDPQHRELLVVDDRTQAAHPGANQRDRVGVGGVGLAALPGREDPGSRGQFRWDIDDLLAFGQQPMSDVAADALQPSIAQTRSGHAMT